MNPPSAISLQPGLLRMPAGLGENDSRAVLPMETLVRRVADRWDAAGISWVVLRHAAGLPEFTRYDLDILVAPEQARKAVAILEACVAAAGWQVAGRMRKYHYQCLLLKTGGDGSRLFFLPVDVFSALQYRGLRYLDAHAVLRQRVKTPKGIWCLPPGVEAAISWLKEVLPHGKLKDNSRETVRAQWVQDAAGFGETIAAAAGAEWAERFAHMLRREEWSLGARDALDLRRHIRRRHPGWRCGFGRALLAHIRHLMRPALGRVICLAGADGSGKTTLAEGLFRDLYKRPFKAARYIHGNIGILPRFRDIRAFVRRLLRLPPLPPRPEAATLQGMMTPLPVWKSMVLATYYACDFSLARWRLRRWRNACGGKRRAAALFSRVMAPAARNGSSNGASGLNSSPESPPRSAMPICLRRMFIWFHNSRTGRGLWCRANSPLPVRWGGRFFLPGRRIAPLEIGWLNRMPAGCCRRAEIPRRLNPSRAN